MQRLSPQSQYYDDVRDKLSPIVRRLLADFLTEQAMQNTELYDLNGLWVLGRLRSTSGWRSELGQYDIDLVLNVEFDPSGAPSINIDGDMATFQAAHRLADRLHRVTSLPVHFRRIRHGSLV